MMRFWVFIGLMLPLISLPPLAVSEEKTIYAVTENWEDYSNADGSGLYWDILHAIYEPEGFQLRTETFPYIRAAEMVNGGQADMLVGAYYGEQENLLYPEPAHAFDADRVIVLYPEEGDWSGIDTLSGKTVAWVRGYEYDQYLDVALKPHEVSTREQAIKMLKAGRIDYVLDAAAEIDALDAAMLAGLARAPAMKLGLYPAFQKSERGRELMAIYDQRFTDLKESGQLQALFEQHGMEWSGDSSSE